MTIPFTKFNLLFAPTDTPSGALSTPLGKGGILDALNDESDVKDKTPVVKDEDSLDLTDDNEEIITDDKGEKDKGEKKDDKDDKDDEEEDKVKDDLAELEEELKEPSPEDLELTTPVKKREILAKYPDVFKDFPSLEKAYYRELEYTKIFPTIEDAREGAQAINVLNNFEADLKKGDTVELFKAVLKDDPNAFAKLADTYMENLAQVDERAYHHVLGNITKDIVKSMVRVGKKSENKALQEGATVLYQFMFGEVDWKEKTQLAIDDTSEVSNEKKEFEKEKQEFETTKFTERKTELMTGVDNRIKSVIDSNIDKKVQMTSFVKKNAIKEVKEKLDGLIKADTRFQAIVNKLWQRAKESKFSRDSLQTIEAAHVSKAKALLPTIILSVKKEALKGITNSRKRDETNDTDETIATKPRNSTTPKDKVDSTSKDKNKPLPSESSLDFLLRD